MPFPWCCCCNTFGGGCRSLEEGSAKVVFLFQQCLSVSIIFMKQILWLASCSVYHFCGSSIDIVSKDCPVCFNIIWAKAQRSHFAVYFSLTMVLLNLETFSHLRTLMPPGCLVGWILMLSMQAINQWSVQHSALHLAFVTLTSCLSLCLMMM